MKRIAISAMLGAALALAAPAQAAPVTADTESRALVLVPLTLVKLDDLDFGTIVPSATSLGTVTIPAGGGPRTAAGAGVTLIASDSGHRARFAGAGSANQFVFIEFTNPGTLSNGPPGDTVTLISMVLDRSALVRIDATRAFFFSIGGTIQIAANQPEGNYTADFDVTVQYL